MATPPNLHLTDLVLQPLLSGSFSVAHYLNSTLPPLSPPQALSSPRPNGVPLSTASAQTTTLLSTLDYHTNRLLTTLTTLTDEILRVSPRLVYEVDLLRSDVTTLGDNLSTTVKREVANAERVKPGGLERLEMLARVRERVEEVVRVFGEAMKWDVGGGGEEGKDLAGEVLYLLAAGEVKKAEEKVEELRLLAGVFEGTVEGPARFAVVGRLEEKVKQEKEKRDGGSSHEERNVMKGEEKKEDAGYYGIIEQLKGLRGI
jgi:hypothetical protein